MFSILFGGVLRVRKILFLLLIVLCTQVSAVKYIDHLTNNTNVLIKESCTIDGNPCDNLRGNCTLFVVNPANYKVNYSMLGENDGWFNKTIFVNMTGLWDGSLVKCSYLSPDGSYYNASDDVSFYVVEDRYEDYLKSINLSLSRMNDSMIFYINISEITKSVRNMNDTTIYLAAINTTVNIIQVDVKTNLTTIQETLRVNFTETFSRLFKINDTITSVNNSIITFNDGVYLRLWEINRTVYVTNITVNSINNTVSIILSNILNINESNYKYFSYWNGTWDSFFRYWNATNTFYFAVDAPAEGNVLTDLSVVVSAKIENVNITDLEAKFKCYLLKGEKEISSMTWYSKVYNNATYSREFNLFVTDDFAVDSQAIVECKIKYFQFDYFKVSDTFLVKPFDAGKGGVKRIYYLYVQKKPAIPITVSLIIFVIIFYCVVVKRKKKKYIEV